MALQKCGRILNKNKLELQPHGSIEFPCAGYSTKHTSSCPDDVVPWHWHEEIELIYVPSGTLKLKVPGKTLRLRKGEVAFINSKILHYAEAEDHCEIHALVFHSSFITGNDASIFARKYLLPLMNCTVLDTCHIIPHSTWEACMVRNFVLAFEAIMLEPSGYEFIVRENLSWFCHTLREHYKKEIDESSSGLSQDSLRLQKMIDFINENYTQTLTLSQIALSADIGERECLRCFHRNLQISPLQYLIRHRITKGASLLQQTPDMSISEISIRCGFDSPSHFAQLFKRFFQCTPRNYRKNYFLNIPNSQVL